jgi:predicted RNA-binding protein with RPS1 domain
VSECSDNFVRNLLSLYDPGDIIKVHVIKCNRTSKRLNLSLKSSHFESRDECNNNNSDKEEKILDVDIMERFDSESENNDFDHVNNSITSNIFTLTNNRELANEISDGASGSDRVEVDYPDRNMSDSKIFRDNAEYSEHSTLIMDTNVGFDWGISHRRETYENSSDDNSISNQMNLNLPKMDKISLPQKPKNL